MFTGRVFGDRPAESAGDHVSTAGREQARRSRFWSHELAHRNGEEPGQGSCADRPARERDHHPPARSAISPTTMFVGVRRCAWARERV